VPESVLAELFAGIDRDASGYVSTEEMTVAFQRLGDPDLDPELVAGNVRAAITIMDVDMNGSIDFEEFCKAADIFIDLAEGRNIRSTGPQSPGPGAWFGGLFGK